MDKIEEVLTRRVEKVYPSKKDLEKVLKSSKKIRLYLGIDPTAPKLHLGHTVPLRKIQEFADLDYEVILLFGTGTVLVGDPSERDAGRKLITEKEVQKNIETWKEQVRPIINFKQIKIKYNGDWITKLTLKDIIEIGSKISAIKLFKRDNFTRRVKAGDTVWYHETMYPLLQAYDSVVMDVDLEVGGTDQTFNMLIGRELMRKMKNKEKYVLTCRMILGTDGKMMSKSSGNCIWLTDSAKDMYGGVMSIQDQLIPDYFEFFTKVPMDKITEIKKELKKNKVNPMVYKEQLALEITGQFHGTNNAKKAKEEFDKVFKEKEKPEEIEEFQTGRKAWDILNLLLRTKLTKSKSEARRLVEQGGVKIDDKVLKDWKNKVNLRDKIVIQVGKRRFVKIKIKE